MVLLLDPDTTYSPMISALGEVSPVLPLDFGRDWTAEAVRAAVSSAVEWAATLSVRPGPWHAADLDGALAYHRLSEEGARR